jgi:hypothetical protein
MKNLITDKGMASLSPSKKEQLSFPCEFIMKVFGLAKEEFKSSVISIVRNHAPDFAETAVQHRAGENGKYLALSITLTMATREQLDAIYRELSASPHVLMAL